MITVCPSWKSTRQVATRFLTLMTACLLSACFDIEHDVRLEADGSGRIQIALITDDVLPADTSFDTILKSPDGRTEVREYLDEGKFVHEETLAFTSLESVRLQDDSMSLVVRDRSFWGLGPARATFTRVMRPIGVADDEFGLLQRVLADRTYRFSLTLPGRIQEIDPVRIDGLEAVPEREGNTITWRIPLGTLTQVEALTFRVQFTTYGDLEPSQSQEATNGVSGFLGTDGP